MLLKHPRHKMSSACCKVLLCLFAVMWIFLPQSANGARNDRRCSDLLRRLLRNPPNNTKIAINIGLSKARYLCREGFKLVGMEIRTCKAGKWKENVEPKCLKPCGKPGDIPHSKVVGSSFNFNDQLRYKCIKGYTLTGPRLRTCGDDGKWSEAPRCEEKVPCGQSLVNVRARIVGGTVSQRGMWPWQIGLYRINRDVPQFFCGGALVSRRWVLTAAHCFYDARGLFIGNGNLYLIKAGDHNLSVNETLQQEIVPERIFVHPRFKPKGLPFFDGDIALVKLSQEVELSTFVRTVCLPEKDEGDLAIPKTRGTVAGWGVTRPLRRGEFTQLSEISKVLRHASFPIQSEQLCVNKSGIQFNTTTAFCAGDGRGGEDACSGDSGGAFVRDSSFSLDSKWVVIGVVSWGNGCAQKDQYGYYTRVHPFLDWIKETMNEKKEPENNKPKNQCSSETTKQQRRRGINLNEDCGLDLVFLFDASVSVNRYYFQTSLEFAKELLTVIGASKRAARTQVAAVTEAKLEFNLGDSRADTIDKAIKAIDNIMYVGWVSSYIRPFKLVRNKVTPNARNDSHQVMMFITDGLDLSGSVRREAKYLRDNKHFEVYAIGIGRKVNTRELMSIASVNQDHDHVISVRRYRNLQEAVQRVVHMNIVLASCQSPGGIAHGNKFGTDYSHNKTVRYECDAEYTLEGKNGLTCNDGKWNYNPPQCKAPCSNPGSPSNGTMHQGDNFRHNSWVIFSCDQHYQRNGNERIKCNDGSWSGSVPVCIAVCPDPGVPNQGMRVGDNFQHGKTVTFECKKNYDLLGNATVRCNGGVWNGETPKCKGRCAFVGNPNNGYTTNGNFRRGELLPHGRNVEYACDVSYILAGSKVLHCDDGSWNASVPSCKASCDDPGILVHGRKTGNDYSHGQIVTYECITQGYSLVGNPRLTCNDGSWDSQRPECKVRSQCGGDLTTDSGEITSPRFPSSYPDNANCEWKIAVDDDSGITLTFVMFEVEGSNKCKYDYLEVSNGQTRDSANRVAKLCGTELPKPIISSGPHLFLRFRSDSSMAFKGFKLQFTKTVLNNCGATLSTLSGEITSPNYPGPYQSNRYCIWKISVPPGNHLQLVFQEINIERGASGKCVFDYVQVFSGTGQEAESLGRYCGKQDPIKLASKAHTMTVTFRSDKMFNSKGFKARFAAVCGAQLHASNNKRQFFSHPSYGDDNYKTNLHCLWQLTARSGYIIRLRFKEFDVENEKLCGYDYVIVRDGSNSTAPLLGRVCGQGSPGSSREFVSTGNRMWIQFRTDLTTNKKGFIAEYWSSFKTGK